jgi:hypothetical protein
LIVRRADEGVGTTFWGAGGGGVGRLYLGDGTRTPFEFDGG